MSEETRRRLLLVGLTLFFTILLTLLLLHNLRDVVRDFVVVPLLYILWLARLFLQSVSQSLLWAIFLTFALVIIVRSLIEYKGRMQTTPKAGKGHQGRIQEMARQIELAERSDYFQYQVARRLGELLVGMVSHSKRPTPGMLQHALDELDAPPEVQVYLQTQALRALPPNRIPSFARIARLLRGNVHSVPPDADLESVVQFLEDRLGVQR
ncbi:MAG: hypothetical protein ACLFV5_05840 [Anaerolineales bacterium]